MNETKIWQNIARKFAGESSDDENQEIDKWRKEEKHNKTIYTILSNIWEHNPLYISNSESVYNRYEQKRKLSEKQNNSTNRFLYYALRISAVLFFLISTVFLANKIFTGNKNNEVAQQEIYVPKGNRTSFILPDGSKVWLSNDSRLKYPSKFSNHTRDLELTGEAYFEVKHDESKPFVVQAGDTKVTALGTKFAVTAYPEDEIVRAELISGRIVFDIPNENNGQKLVELEPSQSFTWNKNSGQLSEAKIPDGFYEYWQNGVYNFQNESLESLSKKIDRIFNIQLLFENDALKERKFSGTININDNIFTFMEAIKRTSLVPIDYNYDKNRIYVKLKTN